MIKFAFIKHLKYIEYYINLIIINFYNNNYSTYKLK